jgi:hypothetical protein
MLIRRFVIAGLVLASMGLTIFVTRGVIGQQPGTTEESSGAGDKNVPANGNAGSLGVADDTIAPTSGESNQDAKEGTPVGSPNAQEGVNDAASPGGFGAASGATDGTFKGRSKSPRGAGMQAPAMGNVPGMAAGGMGMPGMSGSGTISVAVPEDEHLETWVSRALADYAKTEDHDARKEQREEIVKALDRIFDIRHDRRMQELETLELRVQKLRVTLETREKLKSNILKDRLEYLTREADGLGWGDGIPAPGRSTPTGIGVGGSSSSNSSKPSTSRRAPVPLRGSGVETIADPSNSSRP